MLSVPAPLLSAAGSSGAAATSGGVEPASAASAALSAAGAVHFVGRVEGCAGVRGNAFCRFNVVHGANWVRTCGDVAGTTQESRSDSELSTWSHPIDVGFVTNTVDGWPRLAFEVFRRDFVDREIASGYSVMPLPQAPGHYVLESGVWRPQSQSVLQRVFAFILDVHPVVLNQSIYADFESRGRRRLLGDAVGTLRVSLSVLVQNAAHIQWSPVAEPPVIGRPSVDGQTVGAASSSPAASSARPALAMFREAMRSRLGRSGAAPPTPSLTLTRSQQSLS